MNNRELRVFLNPVLKDFELVCDYSTFENGASDYLYVQFMKQLRVLNLGLNPMHRGDFEEFFTSIDLTWNNITSLLRSHFSKMLREFSDIFTVLMYAYSFAHSLLLFCINNGYMYTPISAFMAEEFINDIRLRFFAEGGWDGLGNFCSALHLDEVLEFINVCYCKKETLLTFVQIEQQEQSVVVVKYRYFGMHSAVTLSSLKKNLKDLKICVRSVFKREIEEMNNSPYLSHYPHYLELLFLKIGLALEWTSYGLDWTAYGLAFYWTAYGISIHTSHQYFGENEPRHN